MKKIIKVVSMISLIGVSIVSANNQGGVILPQSTGNSTAQDKRIIANFKKIDRLFASINKRIASIEKTKEDIKVMIQHKDEMALCEAIEGMDAIINQLEKKINKVNDVKKKNDLEKHLSEVRNIRNEEKNKMTYTCKKL